MPSTTFLSTPFTAPLAPLDQMARSISGTRMPSTVSRAIPTWVVASPQPSSTRREASSPMPSATTGARASNITLQTTQSRSCCIPLTTMNASLDHQLRRGKARGEKRRDRRCIIIDIFMRRRDVGAVCRSIQAVEKNDE